ncbi:hypothetical protein D9613_010226 [Agrocybe pediades]|uniref:Uncharacterized protein n=1 Tax=Agrocybe pediades TaxID=84607 RepID=A0A8H4QF67_9AGAR|nr:hypothetical protein D9613_010226 [Agrocybe pediades]
MFVHALGIAQNRSSSSYQSIMRPADNLFCLKTTKALPVTSAPPPPRGDVIQYELAIHSHCSSDRKKERGAKKSNGGKEEMDRDRENKRSKPQTSKLYRVPTAPLSTPDNVQQFFLLCTGLASPVTAAVEELDEEGHHLSKKMQRLGYRDWANYHHALSSSSVTATATALGGRGASRQAQAQCPYRLCVYRHQQPGRTSKPVSHVRIGAQVMAYDSRRPSALLATIIRTIHASALCCC